MKHAWIMIGICVGSTAFGQELCGPEQGDCYEPHENPGCLQPGCCELVCEEDVFCCNDAWDETCVDLADELCGGIRCPNWGECDEFHDTPGCIDEVCCEHTRLHDPFCGWGIWDEMCVREAEAWCSIGKCEVIPPEGAIDEGESCLERINDGCNLIEPDHLRLQCGETLHGKCVSSTPRDTDWLPLEPHVRTRYTLDFNPEFPGRMLLVQGECEGPLRVLDQRNALPCGFIEWELVLDPGTWFVVVDSGNEDRTVRSGLPCDEIDPETPPKKDEEPPPSFYGLNYLLTLHCEPLEFLPGDLNGDGRVNGEDLGLLFVAWGSNPGSPADLNGDGVVDGEDLGLFFVNWTG